MNEHMAHQRDSDTKRVKLDDERLSFERQRYLEEQRRADRVHELETKRLELDKRKVALEESRLRIETEERVARTNDDMEDRKVGLQERKEVIALMGALVKKLG